MKTYRAQPLFSQTFQLAEGPFYQKELDLLSWVDIPQSSIVESRRGKIENVHALGQFVGAAIPAESGGYVVALTTGIHRFDPEQGLERLCVPESLHVNQRFNDAKCDPSGKLWAGTMRLFGRPMAFDSHLYRIDAQGECLSMREGVGLSNGMAFAPQEKTFYHIDTPTQKVDVFDYDPIGATLGQKRDEIEISQGTPDGMTIDQEGMLWVALWGGSAVLRIDPREGKTIGKVSLPTANVTSCCFAGSDLSSLVITTAASPKDADSGRLYVAQTDTAGLPEPRFKG